MRVHVIDADRSSRGALKRFLEARGVRVTESTTVKEGSSSGTGRSPSAVVVGFTGRGASAAETLRAVREFAPGVPLILWTDEDHSDRRLEIPVGECAVVSRSAPLATVAFELARLGVGVRPGEECRVPELLPELPRPDTRVNARAG